MPQGLTELHQAKMSLHGQEVQQTYHVWLMATLPLDTLGLTALALLLLQK